MWHVTKAAVRRWVERLLHIHDTPERTAAAFALGVGIGFSPFLGFHTVMGLALAFALNLNRVAVLVGCYVHLPWFMAPYYAGVTALGSWLTGRPIPAHLVTRLERLWTLPTWHARWDAVTVLAKPLLVPFIVGGTLVAVVIGGAAYPVALAFIRARRRHYGPPGHDQR